MVFIDKEQFIENFQYFDKEIVYEIIEIFINEYPDRMKSISESIETVDHEKIKFSCHSIKGVIANFIAPEVEQQARELEMMGTLQNVEGINELFAEFKASTAIMIDELKIIKQEFK
jgi:two-component system, sensor histidine kinase and response regulator